MAANLRELVGQEVIEEALKEVQKEIKEDGINVGEKVNLYCQLGSLYGLLGKIEEQKKAWQQALKLDPNNIIILYSLKSLKT